jgi:MscS family membrane protein
MVPFVLRSIALLVVTTLAFAPLAFAAAGDDVSPRAALSRYLELCREGQHADAARFLQSPAGMEQRGPELARRLKAVLDRHVWFDLERISDQPGGDTEDGLGPDLEELAQIPGPRGSPDPVRMIRVHRGDGPAWLFTPGTVSRIDGWYTRLGDRWLLDHLPAFLLRPGPRDVIWWQWLALPILLLVALALGLAVTRLCGALLSRIAARSAATWDDVLVERLRGPTRLFWWMALFAMGARGLDLYAPAQRFADELSATGIYIAGFWALVRSTDILGRLASGSVWARSNLGSHSLVPLAVRSGKVAIFAFAVVGILSLWGYPITTLLAGLGIGGLALALAAQKTVENLFGSFSIAIDRPFREGDFVKIEDFVGTVEAIGLRSTRVRTLDRTLVTIPNGKLADMRLESFTARDRIRLACVLGVVYGTTAAQMRSVLSGLERVLREHPKIWPDAVVVRFKEFAASSLDIEVMAWFQTPDWGEFQLIRQDVLLAFMEVVESAGTSFAFPTQTVHVELEGDRCRALTAGEGARDGAPAT